MKSLSIACLLLSSQLAFCQEKSKPFGHVIVDNDQVKVIEMISQPGKDVCGLGRHSHPPHLTVLFTEATVIVTNADGKAVTRKMPAGTTFWSDAETHTVINSGHNISRSQIIEYKEKK